MEESFSHRAATRAKSTIMMAFFIMMPTTSIQAIEVTRVNSVRVSISARSAPKAADGSVDRIVNGCA